MTKNVFSFWFKKSCLNRCVKALVLSKVLFSIVFLSVDAHALTLGSLSVDSYLDKPLQGTISVSGNSGDNLSSLVVSMASDEEFKQAGISRSQLLDDLVFTLDKQVGKKNALIKVSSDNPINDPFVHMLLKFSWNGGQLLREFTALIDPPIYASENKTTIDSAVSTLTSEKVSEEKTPDVNLEKEELKAVYEEPLRSSRASSNNVSLDTVVASNDSLSMIAKGIQDEYPDLSIYQIMVALHRDNPSAFIDNNINGLIKGSVLKVDDIEKIGQLSRAKGVDFFYDQLAVWKSQAINTANTDSNEVKVTQQAGRTAKAGEASDLAQGSESSSSSPSAVEGVNSKAEFQVSSTDFNETAASKESQGAVANLEARLSDLEASFESKKLENKELKSTIAILENQLADSNRLIELSNQELASLQQSPAEAAIVKPTSEIIAEQPEVKVESDNSELDKVDEAAKAEPLDDTKLGEIAAEVEQKEEKEVAPVVTPDTTTAKQQESEKVATPTPPIQPKVAELSLVEKATAFLKDKWRLLAIGLGGLLFGGLLINRLRGGSKEESDFEMSFTDFTEDSTQPPASNISDSEQAVVENKSSTSESVSSSTVSSIDLDALREATQSVTDFEVSESESGAEVTKESSFLTVYNDGDVVVNADEIDPIAEADVYIAYGRQDQGEEVLLEGVKNFPERSDIKVKLLQLYSDTEDRAKFDDVYGQLSNSGLERDIEEWQKVEELRNTMMGIEAPASNVAESASTSLDGQQSQVDAGGTIEGELSEQLDFDVTVSSIAEELSESLSNEITLEVTEVSEELSEINDDDLKFNDDVVEAEDAINIDQAGQAEAIEFDASENTLSQSNVEFTDELLTETDSVDIELTESKSNTDLVEITAETDTDAEISEINFSDEDLIENASESLDIDFDSNFVDIDKEVTEVSFADEQSESEVLEAMDVDLSSLDIDSVADFSKSTTVDEKLDFINEITEENSELDLDIGTIDAFDHQEEPQPDASLTDDSMSRNSDMSLSIDIEDTELNNEDTEISIDFSPEELEVSQENSINESIESDVDDVVLENDLDAIDLSLGEEISTLPDGVNDPVTQLDLAKVFLELDDVSGAVKILKSLKDDETVGSEASELLSKHS